MCNAGVEPFENEYKSDTPNNDEKFEEAMRKKLLSKSYLGTGNIFGTRIKNRSKQIDDKGVSPFKKMKHLWKSKDDFFLPKKGFQKMAMSKLPAKDEPEVINLRDNRRKGKYSIFSG